VLLLPAAAQVNKLLEAARADGVLGSAPDARVTRCAPADCGGGSGSGSDGHAGGRSLHAVLQGLACEGEGEGAGAGGGGGFRGLRGGSGALLAEALMVSQARVAEWGEQHAAAEEHSHADFCYDTEVGGRAGGRAGGAGGRGGRAGGAGGACAAPRLSLLRLPHRDSQSYRAVAVWHASTLRCADCVVRIDMSGGAAPAAAAAC
jgi:hypothetical protein